MLQVGLQTRVMLRGYRNHPHGKTVTIDQFEREFANTSLVFDALTDQYKALESKLGHTSISELVNLKEVLAGELNDGQYLNLIKDFYGKLTSNAKMQSQPVARSHELCSIATSKETTDAQKITALIEYYFKHFSARSPAQIIRDGYTVGQRNDFATAITHAMPKTDPALKMYDEYYQNRKSFEQIHSLVDKAKQMGELEEDFLSTQLNSVSISRKRASYLGSPENKAAAHLSAMIEVAILALEVHDNPVYADLYRTMMDNIRTMADSVPSFKQQSEFIEKNIQLITDRADLVPDLKSTLLAIFTGARRDIHIPSDMSQLELLDLISQLRMKFIDYRAEAIEHSNETKLDYIQAAIQKLDLFGQQIRTGAKSPESIREASGVLAGTLEAVTCLPQFLFYAKGKLSEDQWKPLEKLLDVQPQRQVVASASSTATKTLQAAPQPKPDQAHRAVPWMLSVEELSDEKMRSQLLTGIVKQFYKGDYWAALLENMKSVPLDFNERLKKAAVNGWLTVDAFLHILIPPPMKDDGGALSALTKGSSSVNLFVPVQNRPVFAEALNMMRERALLAQYIGLIADAESQPAIQLDAMMQALPLFKKHEPNTYRSLYLSVYIPQILDTPLKSGSRLTLLSCQVSQKSKGELPTVDQFEALRQAFEATKLNPSNLRNK